MAVDESSLKWKISASKARGIKIIPTLEEKFTEFSPN